MESQRGWGLRGSLEKRILVRNLEFINSLGLFLTFCFIGGGGGGADPKERRQGRSPPVGPNSFIVFMTKLSEIIGSRTSFRSWRRL